MTRWLSILAAAFLLGACSNYVVSEKVVITPETAVPEPAWKNGIWVAADKDKPCDFDGAKPVMEWPACAEPLLIKDERLFKMLVGLAEEQIGNDPEATPMLSVEMAPLEADFWVVQVSMGDAGQKLHFFLNLERGSVDAQGKATAFALGALQCGPSEKGPDGKPKPTTTPYPGAVMTETVCQPDGIEGLKSLARANRGKEVQRVRWVRAAEPAEIRYLDDKMEANRAKMPG